MADPNDLADELEREASAQDHYCSEVGNWAGGYDCNCGRSAWYTHLSTPPHQGCLFEWRLRAAARLLREQAEQLDIQTALATNYAGKAVEYKQEKERAEEQLDTLRTTIEKLIPWAESYRMQHVVVALRELLALASAGGGVPEEGA